MLIPAGLLIGMGISFATNQLVAGLFIGLGAGLLTMFASKVLQKK